MDERQTPWLQARFRFPVAVAAGALIIIGAVVLYSPLLDAPLEIVDYSELLLVMPGTRDFLDTWASLTTYFAGHGRFLPVTHGFIALNWALFGEHSAGWQIVRGAVMLACVAAAFVLLRRVGATRLAAAAGATLFIVAPGASASWIRLSGEPHATLALLGAGIIATYYGTIARWRAAAVVMAALSSLAVFAKETSIAAVPFVLGLAWYECGRHSAVRVDSRRRRRWLLATSFVMLAATVAATLLVALDARTNVDSYAAQYGHASTLSTFTRRALWIMLPFPPGTAWSRGDLLRLPPNAIFCGLIVIAGLVATGTREVLTRWASSVLVFVALGVAGTLVYHPWPRFESLYTLPFLFGSSLALAASLSAVEQLRPRLAWLAYAAFLGPVFYMSALARETVVRTVAWRTVNARIVAEVAARPAESVVLIADPSRPKQEWQSVSATIARYAEAVDARRAPTVVGVSCTAVHSPRLLSPTETMLVSYLNVCGTLKEPRRVISSRFRYLSWRTFSMVEDSVRADVVLAVAASPRGSPRR